MYECECTKLTGKCRHDCPVCGGEGVLAKKQPTTEEFIEYTEKVVREASKHLVFEPAKS